MSATRAWAMPTCCWPRYRESRRASAICAAMLRRVVSGSTFRAAPSAFWEVVKAWVSRACAAAHADFELLQLGDPVDQVGVGSVGIQPVDRVDQETQAVGGVCCGAARRYGCGGHMFDST